MKNASQVDMIVEGSLAVDISGDRMGKEEDMKMRKYLILIEKRYHCRHSSIVRSSSQIVESVLKSTMIRK